MSIVSFDNSVSEFVVDSLTIAESLGKPHHVLMKIIRRLNSTVGQTRGQDYFILTSRIDVQNKTVPIFKLTQKGVILLMSRMQDQIEWLLKLSDTFTKLQKELLRKIPDNKLNGYRKGQNQLKEKVETDYGTSFRVSIPDEERTIIPYANILKEHGMESEKNRQPVKSFDKLVICDLLVEQSDRSTEGKLEANKKYHQWQRAVHLAFDRCEPLPLPSTYDLSSKYDFSFKN